MKKSKIIGIDNYDREIVNDELICENISEYYGKIFVDNLNAMEKDGPTFYKLVPDDYKLFKYEP